MLLSENKKEIVSRGHKTVWDCGDSIVKAFDATKPASDVINEALNVARVAEAGAPAPKLLEVSPTDEGWALRTDRFEGQTLEQIFADNPEQLDELLEQFVVLQLKIQDLSAPLLPRQKDKFVRMINNVDAINATTRYDLLMRLDGMKVEEKVCHGDFNFSNVLVNASDETRVVDWAHATQGTPAADVAMTYMEFHFEQSPDIANKYLDLYCDKADMPKQLVFRWLPIVAAAELYRGHKDYEKQLLSWIDVAEWQ